jgi:hypothetical protein
MTRHHLIPLYASVFTFLAVLFFGLNPKGYDFSNHVSRISDGPGLRFDKYGIAYTLLDDRLPERIGKRDGFSVLMVFQSRQLDNNGCGHILTIHGGDDRKQLVIWQWFSHIIAMNDTDYAHRRKIGRVSAPIPSSPAQEIYLSLTTGKHGTTLYFDGKVVSSNRSLLLDFPAGIRTTLVLGNSVYGNDPWQGNISGLALFDRELQPESIVSLYNSWIGKRSFTEAEKENPFLHFLFIEKEGTRIIDHAGGSTPLRIPSRATPVIKRILAKPMDDSGLTVSLTRDALINLVGFIPLGFFFTAVLINLCRIPGKKSVVYAVIFCFAVSLTIEVLQSWIPSRSSQSLDLLLNTAGAFLGAFISKKITAESG